MNSNRYKSHSGGNEIAMEPARLAVRLIAADGNIPLFAAARWIPDWTGSCDCAWNS